VRSRYDPVTFKYDSFGRRICERSPDSTSIFAYDGDNQVETVNSSDCTVARYAQRQNIDEPLAMQRGGTTDYHEQDGLGSVTSADGRPLAAAFHWPQPKLTAFASHPKFTSHRLTIRGCRMLPLFEACGVWSCFTTLVPSSSRAPFIRNRGDFSCSLASPPELFSKVHTHPDLTQMLK